MAEPAPRAVVVIPDWPGLMTNAGAMGGPAPGSAAEQVNLAANVPGELAARQGYRVVTFDPQIESVTTAVRTFVTEVGVESATVLDSTLLFITGVLVDTPVDINITGAGDG